jgi:predicted PurR-regulated permease PerM
MNLLTYLTAWLASFYERARDDRGDVPGWVMVTVMTAILVVAILGVFEPQIKDAITSAIDSVTGSK